MKLNLLVGVLMTVFGLTVPAVVNACAADRAEVATEGAGGYDVVSYFTESVALRGNGRHIVEYQGVTYLFSSEENKKSFEKNPRKYLPAFGGYCAYGVALGKKFWGDPGVWEIVNGTLYLNLDKGIQREWEKDKPGYIEKANSNWSRIKHKSPGEL
jgi:YHS domain-containing protein